jgi:hypothetical protein
VEGTSRTGRFSQTAISGLRVKGALTPVLWISAFLTPSLLYGVYQLRDSTPLLVLLSVLLTLTVATPFLGFWYFALTAPDKLQSEDYQIRQQTLQMIQLKTDSIALKPAVLEALMLNTRRAVDSTQESGE